MNTKDRYLNVQYGTLTAEVDITGIHRLGLPAEEEYLLRKRQGIEISDLTTQLHSFKNSLLIQECIQSPNQVFLPYPQDEIQKE